VLLGTIFRRRTDQSSQRVDGELSEAEGEAIVVSGGRQLFKSYWGRYVAFLHDAARQTSWVLRDPTAGLPCYSCATIGGVTIYFTELEDVIGVQPLTVNWGYLGRALCVTGGLQNQNTALAEIGQVLGGERVESARAQVSRSFLWDAWAIAQDTLEDPMLATAALRRTTMDVVHAWASCHRNVLHGLGGLDSAIVCTCLTSAPSRPSVTAYTYYSQGAGSDERAFARLVADRAGVELLTVERNPAWDLESLLSETRCSPVFVNQMSYVEPAFVEGDLARRIGATGIASGFGGDQLFVQCRSRAAVDYVVTRGLGPDCWSVALDNACMDGESVWAVLWDMVKTTVFRRSAPPGDFFPSSRVLLPDHLLSAAKRDPLVHHPQVRAWLAEVARGSTGAMSIGSGKASQVRQLLYPPAVRNPLAPDDPEYIAPLFSQPLLELCLRIPTFVHTAGGQDRVIARRAFRNRLPREVTNRWAKGFWEEQAAALLRHNIRFVRSLLLDGELVRRGLLIRSRVEEWLSYRATRLAISNVEIFDAIFAEAWLQRVRSLGSRASL
jgi:asparagine synthase (glutamine-hydrolysing)